MFGFIAQKVLTKLIRTTPDEQRSEVADWLSLPNETIMKSERFESLINKCCLHYYKKSSSEISDDNLSFIRRSANELLRNKASKEAMKKRLLSNDYRYEEDLDDVDVNQNLYAMNVGMGVRDHQ